MSEYKTSLGVSLDKPQLVRLLEILEGKLHKCWGNISKAFLVFIVWPEGVKWLV